MKHLYAVSFQPLITEKNKQESEAHRFPVHVTLWKVCPAVLDLCPSSPFRTVSTQCLHLGLTLPLPWVLLGQIPKDEQSKELSVRSHEPVMDQALLMKHHIPKYRPQLSGRMQLCPCRLLNSESWIYFSFIFYFLFMCVPHACRYPQKPEESIGSCRARVTCRCK